MTPTRRSMYNVLLLLAGSHTRISIARLDLPIKDAPVSDPVASRLRVGAVQVSEIFLWQITGEKPTHSNHEAGERVSSRTGDLQDFIENDRFERNFVHSAGVAVGLLAAKNGAQRLPGDLFPE